MYVSPCIVEFVRGPRRRDNPIRLHRELTFRAPSWEFTVPAGFHSDGPSLPRLLRNIIPIHKMWLQAIEAGIGHDALYRTPELRPVGWDQKAADDFFLSVMEHFNRPNAFRRQEMYYAVRCFGHHSWRE